MRNSKKLIAVIMTVALLASMMVPALAAVTYQTDADKLQAAGILAGTGTGLNLGGTLTRDEGIALAIAAMGKKAVALALTDAEVTTALAKVEDAASIPVWARKYAAYAVSTGMTSGIGGAAVGYTNFGSKVALTGKQFLAFVVRGMGYGGVTLNNAADKAITAGLSVSRVVAFATKTPFLRDDAAGLMYSAINDGMVPTVAGGVTASAIRLVTNLVTVGALTTTAAVNFAAYTLPTPAPAPALTVSAITALNLKQVLVSFNMALDKTTAETAANYEVYDLGGSTKFAGTYSPVLQADLKSVLVTLVTTDTTVLTNLSNAKVVVKAAVKDAAGVALVADYTSTTVAVSDAVRPTIVKAEQTAPTKVLVTFSEPVKDVSTGNLTVDANNFKFDGGAYIVTAAGSSDVAGYSIEITLGTTLTATSHTITVNPTGGDIADMAGFLVAADSNVAFTVVADVTPPSVTLKNVSQTSATFVFSETPSNAKDANVVYRHSVNSTSYQVDGTSGNVTVVGKEVTVAFNTAGVPVPVGTVTFFIDYLSSTGTKITDAYSNAMAAQAITATVTADSTKPTVTVALKTDSNTVIQVTASEALTAPVAANFVLKKGTETVTQTFAQVGTTNVYEITAGSEMSGTYTLLVTGLKDQAVVANTMVDYTATIVVADTIKPAVADEAYAVDASPNFWTQSGNKVRIYFTEAMNTTDLTTLTNYQNVSDTSANPTAATAAADSKSVYLTFANAIGGNILMGQLRDTAGNKMLGVATTLTPDTGSNVGVDTTVTNNIVAVSPTLIKVYLNDTVTGLAGADFEVNITGAGAWAPGTVSQTIVGGKSVISITLATAIADGQWDTAAPRVRTASATGVAGDTATTKNAYDKKVTIASSPIVDNVVPTLATTNPITTVDADGNGMIDHIKITFSELMNKNFVSADKFTVTGYTVLDAYAATAAVAASEQAGRVTAIADAKTIYVTVDELATADTAAVPTVTIATGLKDVSLNSDGTVKGNAYAGLSTATAAVDTAAPVLMSWTFNANLAGDAKSIALTFSEPVTAANFAATGLAFDSASAVFAAGVALAAGTETQTSSNVITVTALTAAKVLAFDGKTDLVAGVAANMYLSVGADAFTDGTNAAIAKNGIACTTFTADSTALSLVSATSGITKVVSLVFNDYLTSYITAAQFVSTGGLTPTVSVAKGANDLTVTLTGTDAIANLDTITVTAIDAAGNAIAGAANKATGAGVDTAATWTID